VRIGLIGAGFMGRKHAEMLAAVPGVELVGVADPFTDAVALEHDVPHHADHRALLEQPGLDAVIIANPNRLHAATTLDCVEAGVAALVEKPVTEDAAEALRLARTIEDSGVPVLVGHHRRHHPAVVAAREVVTGGGLGTLVAVNGMWLTRKDDAYFDVEWHRSAGAGVMLINLVHDLDLLRYVCGEIVAIQATVSHASRDLAVEDTVSLTMRFESGALGSFIASDAAASPWTWDQATEDFDAFPFAPDTASFFLAGTAGSLSVPNLARYSYAGSDPHWHHPMSKRYEPRATGDSYTRQLEHFAAVVRREVAPSTTVRDAAMTHALLDAVRVAAETGRTVSVDGVDHSALDAQG
jgi:predicted dehydrogenase